MTARVPRRREPAPGGAWQAFEAALACSARDASHRGAVLCSRDARFTLSIQVRLLRLRLGQESRRRPWPAALLRTGESRARAGASGSPGSSQARRSAPSPASRGPDPPPPSRSPSPSIIGSTCASWRSPAPRAIRSTRRAPFSGLPATETLRELPCGAARDERRGGEGRRGRAIGRARSPGRRFIASRRTCSSRTACTSEAARIACDACHPTFADARAPPARVPRDPDGRLPALPRARGRPHALHGVPPVRGGGRAGAQAIPGVHGGCGGRRRRRRRGGRGPAERSSPRPSRPSSRLAARSASSSPSATCVPAGAASGSA